MKKMFFALAFMMATTICVEGHNGYNGHLTVTVQKFYNELSPYGNWLNTADYGYVWRPFVNDAENFKPYYNGGNWVNTDQGWTWVSEYPWGWAAFHYGRWYCDDHLGWMWIPGDDWAPAWVTWGAYDDMWAWAPMGPEIRVNVNLSWYAPVTWWTFVPRRHFCEGNWHAYVYRHPVQIARITHINNIYRGGDRRQATGWYYGPRVRDVEKDIHERVRTMRPADVERHGSADVHRNRVDATRLNKNRGTDNQRKTNVTMVERHNRDTRDGKDIARNRTSYNPVKETVPREKSNNQRSRKK